MTSWLGDPTFRWDLDFDILPFFFSGTGILSEPHAMYPFDTKVWQLFTNIMGAEPAATNYTYYLRSNISDLKWDQECRSGANHMNIGTVYSIKCMKKFSPPTHLTTFKMSLSIKKKPHLHDVDEISLHQKYSVPLFEHHWYLCFRACQIQKCCLECFNFMVHHLPAEQLVSSLYWLVSLSVCKSNGYDICNPSQFLSVH